MDDSIDPKRKVFYRALVFLVAIAIAMLFAALYHRNPSPEYELKTDDALNRFCPQVLRKDVVILGVDSADVQKYGSVKMWPRTLLAQGVDKVEAEAPKLIVMDLALNARTNTGDASLWHTVANRKNIVFGMAYNADRPQHYTNDDIRSLTFLEKFALANNLTLSSASDKFTWSDFEPPVSDFTGSARGVGVFVRETDPDGIVRNARLFYNSTVAYPQTSSAPHGKFPVSQLSDGAPVALLNLAMIATMGAADVGKEYVRATSGGTVGIAGNLSPRLDAPVDVQGRMLLRFVGPAGTIPRVSFSDLMSGKIPADYLKDKIVVIGATATNDPATDAEFTAYRDTPMPRSEVTANAITTLLNRSYVTRNEEKLPGIMITIGLVVGLTLMLFGGLRLTIASIVLLSAYLALCYFLFSSGHMLLPIVGPIVTIVVTWLIGLVASLGAFRTPTITASPTYVDPTVPE